MIRRPRPGRAAVLFGALLPLLGLAGCDDGSGPDEEEDVFGTWLATFGEVRVFFDITEQTLTVFDGGRSPECFSIVGYDILARSGSEFEVQVTGATQSFSILLERDGEDLVLTDLTDGRTLRLWASEEDTAGFEECRGSGGEPGTACASLPQIAVGASVEGELTSDDAGAQGFRYDLYSLTLDAAASVQIDLESDDFDAYLFVYDEQGTLVGEDDDSGADFDSLYDSRLILELEAGCYRIEARAWRADQLGTYVLGVT